jgi:hypothetical protein
MIKFRLPITVGKVTITQYVLLRDGVDVAQWHVTTADGDLVIGPFSSLEEAMEAARSAQKTLLMGDRDSRTALS